MNKVKINILTRTSNRPKGFERLRASIESQTFKNIRHIVSYDDNNDLSYLKENSGYDLFYMDREKLIESYNGEVFSHPRYFLSPHNLYLNELLKEVKEGWVIFIDDDDYLYNASVLEHLSQHLTDDTDLVFTRMKFGNNRVIPSDKVFKKQKIVFQDIGGSCFVSHYNISKKIQWDMFKCSDFRYIKKIKNISKKTKWVNQIVIIAPSAGAGEKNDMK